MCPGCSLACAVVVMKKPEAVESCRLDGLLEAALVREARLWKVPVFKADCIQGADISSSQHQDVIIWLGDMNRLLHFCPETFALAVCVLKRLLSTVKAQPKYLKCIAFTSLVLAAKINEEDEAIGSVKDLVVQSGCNFSTAEIVRMEKIILDKLHWDLYTATAVDFIHIVSYISAHARQTQ
ncbi:cyclin-I [Thalassophryne amazonica]|uniref:cyclin-I n=1 Tax=Thalassophryne amazonica TaxID=390379 RepID=UPI0014708B14|nr:cyclin-I [Thalassophryne amazonica]